MLFNKLIEIQSHLAISVARRLEMWTLDEEATGSISGRTNSNFSLSSGLRPNLWQIDLGLKKHKTNLFYIKMQRKPINV